MRNLLFTLALAAIAAAGNAAPGDKTGGNSLNGDYVEARTASVFAGPCHYNGELTTTGRDAELAWHVRDGAWNGVSVSDLNALAAVTSSENLKDATAPRRSVLFIDSRASAAQAEALASALQDKYAKSLGTVVAVRRAPIHFSHTGETYRVDAKGVTTLAVDAMPNHECCKQPNLVWYDPLIAVTDRKVGYTRESGIEDKTLGAVWTKNGQNTAFYGSFALK